MNEGLLAYQKYLAIKRHFTNEKYDYFKYNGKVKCSAESFMKRNDRFTFKRIEKKYEGEMTDYFVANLVEDSNGWVGDLREEVYMGWKKRTQALTYTFRTDLEHLYSIENDFDSIFRVKGEMPILLKEFINKHVSLETLVILDDLIGYSEVWNNKLDELVWSKYLMKIRKYAPFLKYDRKKMKDACLQIILPKLEDAV